MYHSSLESAPEAFYCEEEFNGVVRDLRAKQHSARSSNSTPSWLVDEQTKVELALQASHATLPGVVAEQSTQFFCHKPNAAQLESMGSLRQVQKNRRAHQNREELLPEPFRGNEEQPLDAFQQSMTNFRIQEEQRTRMENDGLMIEKKKRMHWLLVAIVAGIVVFVGTGVRVAVGLTSSPSRGAEEIEGAEEAETNYFQDCYMRNDTLPSDRFVQLRNVVSSVWRWGAGPSLVESAGSSPRAALCWLSAVDRFEMDISNTTEHEVIQRFALATTYYHFVGTDPADQGNEGLSESNWLDNVHACAWNFVTCDPNKRITELFLDNMQFGDKQIPEVLALMSDLVDLKLTSSRLTGQVPSSLSRLTQLLVLDLHSNALEGTIPSELGSLLELRAMNLSRNVLTSEIPRQLFEIPQLHDLVLTNNFLTGMLPDALSNATSLTTFSVELGAFFRGAIPDISKLTNLEYLGISGSMHVHGFFPDISRMTKLGERIENFVLGVQNCSIFAFIIVLTAFQSL